MQLKGTLPAGRQYDWARGRTVEECLEGLRKLSGLDLGDDPEAWARWWAEERVRLDIGPDF